MALRKRTPRPATSSPAGDTLEVTDISPLATPELMIYHAPEGDVIGYVIARGNAKGLSPAFQFRNDMTGKLTWASERNFTAATATVLNEYLAEPAAK